MQKIFTQLSRLKEYATDAENVYDRLKSRVQDPQPLLIMLPLAYKHILEKNTTGQFADKRLLAFIGQYLTVRYPELSQYFVGKEHQESIASLRQTLDDFLKEKECKQKTQNNYRGHLEGNE